MMEWIVCDEMEQNTKRNDGMGWDAIRLDGMEYDAVGYDATGLGMSAAYSTYQAASNACHTYLHTTHLTGTKQQKVSKVTTNQPLWQLPSSLHNAACDG